MEVKLAYGTDGLPVEVPGDRATVVEPEYHPGAEDPVGLLRGAVKRPVSGPSLRDLVRPGQKVAISVCDVTRPQPRDVMLQVVLDELDGMGVTTRLRRFRVGENSTDPSLAELTIQADDHALLVAACRRAGELGATYDDAEAVLVATDHDGVLPEGG